MREVRRRKGPRKRKILPELKAHRKKVVLGKKTNHCASKKLSKKESHNRGGGKKKRAYVEGHNRGKSGRSSKRGASKRNVTEAPGYSGRNC